MTVEVAQELLEEVTVVGPRSLQLEAFAAQDTSFGMFNNMIDDENFRITCRREQPEPLAFDPTVTISRPRVRVCSTRYMDRESVREVREFFAGFGDANPSRAIQRHLRSLNEKINELAGEDPEFYLAMRKWRELSTEYLDERAERMSE
jgi:hypothetical protein